MLVQKTGEPKLTRLPDHIHEQAIDLKCVSQVKAEFLIMDVEDIWLALPTSFYGRCKVVGAIFILIPL